MATTVTVSPTLGHAVLFTQGGVGTSPGYDAIDLRRLRRGASGGQPRVFDVTGWKVSERAAGANMTVDVAANVGLAVVDGTNVAFQDPYVVAPHSAVASLDVAAAHGTNPRVDSVFLVVRDTTHDASGFSDTRLVYSTGTATSGATLDNRTNAPTAPANSLLLADVLVPAADTTISNSQIRDRRRWAKGAYWKTVRTSNAGGTNDYITNSLTVAAVDDTNMEPRIECSGVPVVVTVTGYWTKLGTSGYITLQALLDDALAFHEHTYFVDDNTSTYLGLNYRLSYRPPPAHTDLVWDTTPLRAVTSTLVLGLTCC
jgi:hypothetical protein